MAIDINDLALLSEFENTIDEGSPDADQEFFNPPPPPNDGAHLVTLGLGKDGVQLTRKRQEGDAPGSPTGIPYLKIALEMRPVEGGDESGYVLFDRVNSLPMPNSGTSRIRAILFKAGVPAPQRCSGPDLAQHIENALSTHPQVTVVTQWRASVKCSDGYYYDALKGQAAFPKGADGRPQATVRVKIIEHGGGAKPQFVIVGSDDPDGVEVRAQAVPVRYEKAEVYQAKAA